MVQFLGYFYWWYSLVGGESLALNERETAIAWLVFAAGITKPGNRYDPKEVKVSEILFNQLLEKGRIEFFPSISPQDMESLFRETTQEIMRIEMMFQTGGAGR